MMHSHCPTIIRTLILAIKPMTLTMSCLLQELEEHTPVNKSYIQGRYQRAASDRSTADSPMTNMLKLQEHSSYNSPSMTVVTTSKINISMSYG